MNKSRTLSEVLCDGFEFGRILRADSVGRKKFSGLSDTPITEAGIRGVLCKKVLLEISQNSQERPVSESL